MPGEAYKERVSYPYAVTYGWPGLPTTTKIVDLQREVTVGTQIHVDRQWWRVTELVPPTLGASHLGHITALPADMPRLDPGGCVAVVAAPSRYRGPPNG